MPKGVPNKRYTPEFKKLVIETMQEEKLSYSETCRRFEVNSRDRIKSWERIYLEEGRRTARPRQHRSAKEAAKGCRRRSASSALNRSTAPYRSFYYHLKQMQKEDKYASVKQEITTIYHENRGRYGYRRITAELRKRTFSVNHKTVQRLMEELGLPCQDEEVSLL